MPTRSSRMASDPEVVALYVMAARIPVSARPAASSPRCSMSAARPSWLIELRGDRVDRSGCRLASAATVRHRVRLLPGPRWRGQGYMSEAVQLCSTGAADPAVYGSTRTATSTTPHRHGARARRADVGGSAGAVRRLAERQFRSRRIACCSARLSTRVRVIRSIDGIRPSRSRRSGPRRADGRCGPRPPRWPPQGQTPAASVSSLRVPDCRRVRRAAHRSARSDFRPHRCESVCATTECGNRRRH